MQTTVQGNSTSNAALWGGRIMSGLVIAFMLLDGGMKLVPLSRWVFPATSRVRWELSASFAVI
jgi:hypothetical protein